MKNNFEKDGIILLNKAKGISSFGAINHLKKIIGAKKVGHTGTLDPMAEGLIMVLINNATKFSDELMKRDKEYYVEMELGYETDSYDLEGVVTRKFSGKIGISDEKIETVISRAEASTRPRDRYDIFNLYQLRQNELDMVVLKKAIQNTFQTRENTENLMNWRASIKKLKESEYQKELWRRYQKGFRYAHGLSFEEPIETIEMILTQLFHD